MLGQDFEIAPKARGKRRKGRTFRAYLLGVIRADALWSPDFKGEGIAPAWLSYLASDQEAKAFTANLRAGEPGDFHGLLCRLPKSLGYRWVSHLVPGGVITTAYQPGLFHLDPVSPFVEDLAFVMAPACAWVEAQAERLAPDFGEDAPEALLESLAAVGLALEVTSAGAPARSWQALR